MKTILLIMAGGFVAFIVVGALLLLLCGAVGLEVYGDQWGRK